MTDSPGVILTLRASSPIPGIIGPAIPSLIIRCSEGELVAYVNSERVLDSDLDDDTSVRLRYDDSEPVSEEWSISTDHTSAFAADPGAFVLGKILNARIFRIELQPFDAAPIVAVFRPAGLRGFLPRLRKACPIALISRDSSDRQSLTAPLVTTSRSELAKLDLQRAADEYKAGSATKDRAQLERAIAVLGESGDLETSDDAKFLLGTGAFLVGQSAESEAQASASCDLARLAWTSLGKAAVYLPAGSVVHPERTRQLLAAIDQLTPVVLDQARRFCR